MNKQNRSIYDEEGQLIYKGEIKNDQYHGEGTLYFQDKTYYKGTFYHGVITGSGKFFDSNNLLIYKGKVKDGHFYDKGKYYFEKGYYYEGDFNNSGELTGQGKCVIDTGVYEGGFSNGRPDGKAKFSAVDGDVYEGIWQKGILVEKVQHTKEIKEIKEKDKHKKHKEKVRKPHINDDIRNGYAKLFYENGNLMYEGEFQDNKYHGAGKLYYQAGTLCYLGYFKNSKFDGKGKFYMEDGFLFYDGDYKEDLECGTGRMYFRDGSVYGGTFKKGFPHGTGSIYVKRDKLIFEGEMYYGLQRGQGNIYDPDTRQITYEGECEDGKMNGQGTFYYSNGDYYVGAFLNNMRHGEGKYYSKDGALEDEADYYVDERKNRMQLYELENDIEDIEQEVMEITDVGITNNQEEVSETLVSNEQCACKEQKEIINLKMANNKKDKAIQGNQALNDIKKMEEWVYNISYEDNISEYKNVIKNNIDVYTQSTDICGHQGAEEGIFDNADEIVNKEKKHELFKV